MNKWFGNLFIAIIISILLYVVDTFTFALNYGLDELTVLVIAFLIWIVLNQEDIMNKKKVKKK